MCKQLCKKTKTNSRSVNKHKHKQKQNKKDQPTNKAQPISLAPIDRRLYNHLTAININFLCRYRLVHQWVLLYNYNYNNSA